MFSLSMGGAPSLPVKQENIENGTPFSPSDNATLQDKAPVRVKAELDEIVYRFLDPAGSTNIAREGGKREELQPSVQEPQHIVPHKQSFNVQHPTTTPILFDEYRTIDEIDYTPENVFNQGARMVQTLKSRMGLMRLGSRLREEVWERDINDLENQGSPTTLIAVCGATGAGKSSILNAILDDNVVPTSGMRACTAVVTEVAYHNKPTIEADITFLSLDEWRSELALLLQDMVDEDGKLKRSTDIRSDTGIAWSKVHAIYPSITQESLVNMSADQIIASDHDVAGVLGTTKRISSKDSRTFAKEISKYIDSKDQKRGKHDTKGKKKFNNNKKDKQRNREEDIMPFIQAGTQYPQNGTRQNNATVGEAALWPLIRQVRVRCKAAALSTGAVLVDLPGVADANAARNNVAKDYMKKADYIWVLAPITRAVDDRIAQDLLGDAFKVQLMNGNYDDRTVTFIATKCDDVSCSEIIHALNLQDNPVLEAIEGRINEIERKASSWKKKESVAEKEAKRIKKELETARKVVQEQEQALEALENGETPALLSKKRKHQGKKTSGSSKKRRTTRKSETESEISETEPSSSSSRDPDSEFEDSSNESSSRSEEEDEILTESEQEAVTEEFLKAKIRDGKIVIRDLRVELSGARQNQKEASDKLSTLKKSLANVQREKNAFCSLERSKYSRDVLKEHFRTGLKKFDDAAAEEGDPDNFDPGVNLRDYEEIDLPVFTCSSRDYVRIQGQVKGDGKPTCFKNINDTGIPELQQWCHDLTVASRERSAHNFLTRLKTFAIGVDSYFQSISKITAADRETLRGRWESNRADVARNYGEEITLGRGIASELTQECRCTSLTSECVEGLQIHFRNGLEEKCRVGAANASSSAVQTSDEFASSMHWATYRATLRRYGMWRQDLNAELALPFTRNIASSWCKVFESDLVAPFEAAVLAAIRKILKEIEESAIPGLRDRFQCQGDLCLEEAHVALQQIMGLVREALSTEQKEASRTMAPHIRDQLGHGYDQAIEERGRGSVARQKAIFHQYVTDHKDEMFEDGAQVIMDRLTLIANAVGERLDDALAKLAEKIEVNVSVLWEGTPDDPSQIWARQGVLGSVSAILGQLELWMKAAEQFERQESQPVEMSDEESADEDVEMSTQST